MQKKQLILTTIFSSLLTIALLAAVFAWGGWAAAQENTPESGEGAPHPADSAAAPAVFTGEGFPAAPQPQDDNLAPAAVSADPNLSHWFIMGSHLQPRSFSTQYTYGMNGCMYVTNNGTDSRFQFPVLLPDGSLIQSMDIFYKDTSSSNLTVWLSRYQPGVNSGDLLVASSSGNAGFGQASSAEISHVVDNSQYAYSLNYGWSNVTDSSIQICGIRINYVDPFFAAFLPSTNK
ncbi:MAG: hypothetical protein JW862_10100 [Anaerolineales bacterium]|nr:hypothetical protein [Anaerolineales bacterium]